jgi:hypothetical protein
VKTIKLLIFSHSPMSRPETIAAAIADGELREAGSDRTAADAIIRQVACHLPSIQTRCLQRLLTCGVSRCSHDPYGSYEPFCKEASA